MNGQGSKTLPPQVGPSVWYGPDVARQESEWLFHFTPSELGELKAAAQELAVWEQGKNPDAISVELLVEGEFERHFAPTLPLIRERMAQFREQLHHGLGFVLWRGIPIEEWSHRVVCAAFLLLGACLGNLRKQNAQGHVLGHVRDLGLTGADPNVRIYQTNERQTFHTDWCDVVGLLCLRTAKSGGRSALVSAGAVYNEIHKQRQDLAAELLCPVPFDRRGEVPKGKLPFYNIRVFEEYAGYFSVWYQGKYIRSSQRFPNAPHLSPLQLEALEYFDATCDDPCLHFTMEFRPGDVQFVHNHTLLHDRTAFEDHTEAEKRRHLLRVWLATPGARPLPPEWAERYGSVEAGNRGGVTIEGVKSIAPLQASL